VKKKIIIKKRLLRSVERVRMGAAAGSGDKKMADEMQIQK
jgi:hypothetical protein